MTRINACIAPHLLCDSHLLAEHREIKRIPNQITSGRANIENIPPSFALGKGHVKFFYDKLGYLKKRYISLYVECLRRDFNVTWFGCAWDNVPDELLNDWPLSKSDRKVVAAEVAIRINERLYDMENIRYFSREINKDQILL